MRHELSNRPLLDTKRDQALLLHTPALDKIITLARQGLNTLVVGERGAGKTTALRATAFALREEGRPVAFVDAAPAQHLLELVLLIRQNVGRSPNLGERLVRSVDAFRVPPDVAGETGAVLEVMGTLRERPQDEEQERICVLLDEARPDLAQALFGRLRDELWQTPLRFVATAGAQDWQSVLMPPADAYFDAVVHLQDLSADAAREFLALRGVSTNALLGGGAPRHLLQIARQVVVEGRWPDELQESLHRRAERVAELGPAAMRLAAELESAGPSSASDPKLLQRLGWSRQRAAQVFRQLETAGVVHGHMARGPDGRSRRMFDLVLIGDEGQLPAPQVRRSARDL